MTVDAFGFWKRVDELKKGMSLSELSELANIKYQQVRHLRSENRYPKANEIYDIAKILGSSSDYLISGEDEKSVKDEDLLFVRDNPLCRKIVRFLMEDERLLEVVGAFVESACERGKEKTRKQG